MAWNCLIIMCDWRYYSNIRISSCLWSQTALEKGLAKVLLLIFSVIDVWDRVSVLIVDQSDLILIKVRVAHKSKLLDLISFCSTSVLYRRRVQFSLSGLFAKPISSTQILIDFRRIVRCLWWNMNQLTRFIHSISLS